MAECDHGTRYLAWDLSINEDGWTCVTCDEKMPGDPPGFRPDLDREHTDVKVQSCLMALHDCDLLYVSNSDMGDKVTRDVIATCRRTGRYDQKSVVAFCAAEVAGNGSYWRKVGEGVLSGNDGRGRCHCGALATSSVIRNGTVTRFCRDHHAWQDWMEDESSVRQPVSRVLRRIPHPKGRS